MSHYNFSIVQLKIDHARMMLGDAVTLLARHHSEEAAEFQHSHIITALSTLNDAYSYIEGVLEEERRQSTSSQVSGVFAVSS